jgi:hypothetical protein
MREFEERIEALTVDEILDYWRGHPPGRYRIVTLGKKKLKVRSTG